MRESAVTVSTPSVSLPVVVVVLLLFCLISFSSLSLPSADATTPITPSGMHTQVSDPIIIGSGPIQTTQYNITGGTRPVGGANLFHSFGDFNVPANNIANFLNDSGLATSNILARVTGTTGNNPSLSSIYGTIQTTGFGNANLFLMNPAGFLFGLHATVNVGGMMTFTTADYLKLTGIGQFNAIPDVAADTLLSAKPVAAFGFLGLNPSAMIEFKGGQLTVADGTGVTLVGGDINLIPDSSGTASGISAHGRPILLTSVTGLGEVAADTGIPALGMALGNITLGQGTTLSTAGIDSSVLHGSGGAIWIRGGQFVTTRATISTGPAKGSTGSGGAATVDVTGSATFTDSFIQTGPVPSSLSGSAGAVSVTAKDGLVITNTSIDASALNAGGDGGSVTLNTNGSLSLTDSIIGTVVDSGSAPGNSGDVTIMGKDVTFNNSGVFTDVTASTYTTITSALGQVHPGTVTVTAENTVTFSGSPFGDPGIPVISATATGSQLDAGSVTITGNTVNLTTGTIVASMSLGQTPSPGNGGTIEIHGNDVSLSQFTLRSENSGFTKSLGRGGNIVLGGPDNFRADSIQLTASMVDAAAVSGGGGGFIKFQANALRMSDGTIVQTSSFGEGAGGNIVVRGAENVTVESGSLVLTDTIGFKSVEARIGTAGDILFETKNLAILSGGQLSAKTLPLSTGNAGNITVQGSSQAQSILIDGAGSGIFTDTQGTGAGGSILVNANQVQLNSGGTITANSTGAADAGNINITAINGLTMHDSSITTLVTPNGTGSSAGGGNIKVTTSDSATVHLQNSTISASVADGSGGGGNISIDPQYVILQNSQILAQAAQGQGGAITIIITNGGLYLPDANSFVNADSGSGVNGTVTIQSPNAPASGQIQPLGKTPLQATSLLNQHCAALADGEFSSFTVAGRDSLPTEPGNWLASPLATLNAGMGLGTKTDGVRPVGQSEQREGDREILSLRQIAPAGFLTQAFAVDWSASCQS